MQKEIKMQNAIWMDMAAFVSTYPELQEALKSSLSSLVRTRPSDPFAFLAEKLREANRLARENKRQQEQAAIKIQSIGRGIRDRQKIQTLKEDEKKKKAIVKIQARQRGIATRARVENIRIANIVWLKELYTRMSPNAQAGVLVSAEDLHGYAKRYAKPRPQFVGFLDSIINATKDTPDKGLEWKAFAQYFGVDARAADEADLHLAATKIQAIQRRRRDTTRVKTLEETRMGMAAKHADGELIRYT